MTAYRKLTPPYLLVYYRKPPTIYRR